MPQVRLIYFSHASKGTSLQDIQEILETARKFNPKFLSYQKALDYVKSDAE
jgi:hypothetical protein